MCGVVKHYLPYFYARSPHYFDRVCTIPELLLKTYAIISNSWGRLLGTTGFEPGSLVQQTHHFTTTPHISRFLSALFRSVIHSDSVPKGELAPMPDLAPMSDLVPMSDLEPMSDLVPTSRTPCSDEPIADKDQVAIAQSLRKLTPPHHHHSDTSDA